MPRRRTSTGRRILAEALENRRLLSAGQLDPTFGSGGKLYIQAFSVNAEAVQSDGKILLAGDSVRRLNLNGTSDDTFGVHGIVELGFSATAMLLQPDGKIVIAGGDSGGNHLLARYSTSGVPDTGFGVGGKVQVQVPGEGSIASLVLATDGRIVQGGAGIWKDPTHPNDPDYSAEAIFASRFNSNGTVDTSFNGVGYVYRESPPASSVAVAVTADGKVLVGSALNSSFALYRYTVAGALDTSFGLGGMATASFSYDSNYSDYGAATVTKLAVQSDGKILAAGPHSLDIMYGSAFARFNTDGSGDTTFTPPSGAPETYNGVPRVYGSSAVATPASSDAGVLGYGGYGPGGLAIQPDGMIITSGFYRYGPDNARPSENQYFEVLRMLPNGARDTTFGGRRSDFPTADELPHATDSVLALGADGNVVVAINLIDDSTHTVYVELARILGGNTPAGQIPFGAIFGINDTIEAENFDNGGEGVSFHDTTPQNIPGKYRNTTVDIGAVSNASNRYAVGYTAPGEWLEYSINAAYSGTFSLQAVVANYLQGGAFHAEIDGVNVTGAMTVPNTGPWDTWTTLTSKTFSMSKGPHVLRISMDTGGYWGNIGDFDSFKITPVGRWPYDGRPQPIYSFGSTIELEKFDNGGEGISYHDTTPQNIPGWYRNTGVDIVYFSSASNSFAVGYTAAGEWLDYSIDVQKGSNYVVTAGLASKGPGGTFHIEIDGTNVTGTLTVPDTGAWDAWRKVSLPTIALTAGEHLMRLRLDSVGALGAVGNFDYIDFDVPATPAVTAQPAAATDPPGDIDTTFGVQGRQLYADPDPVALPNSLQRRVSGVTVQPDGKILLAGSVGAVAGQGAGQISLRRLNPDGTPDPSFGANGEILTSIGPVSFATCILLQSDGKILLGGGTEDSATAPTTASFALERFTANGILDPTFGSGGKLVTDFPGNEKIDSIALTSTGKIVAAGSYFLSPNIGFDVARYNSDGSPDTSLNGTGKLSYSLGQPVGTSYAVALAVQADGKILVGSQLGPSAAVFRFTSGGVLDSNFASTGIVTMNAAAANALALQSDGDILVATVSASSMYSIFRFNPIGYTDYDFGQNGSVSAYYYSGNYYPTPPRPVGALMLQPDGNILLVGNRRTDVDRYAQGTMPLVRRYLGSGVSDPTFTTDTNPGYMPLGPYGGPVAAGAALAPDGKLVVASNVWPYFSQSLHWTAVTRYQNNTNAPSSTPRFGTPLPATLPMQAEDFDNGGEGVAFHDTTPANLGGKYRSTAVDINGMGSNGYCVGYTAAGEWLNYTIRVPSDGYYTLQAQVACVGNGGTFHATFDGKSNLATSTLTVPDTGGWANFKTVTSQSLYLSAGTHMMRITLDTAGPLAAVGNFDFFKLVAAV